MYHQLYDFKRYHVLIVGARVGVQLPHLPLCLVGTLIDSPELLITNLRQNPDLVELGR